MQRRKFGTRCMYVRASTCFYTKLLPTKKCGVLNVMHDPCFYLQSLHCSVDEFIANVPVIYGVFQNITNHFKRKKWLFTITYPSDNQMPVKLSNEVSTMVLLSVFSNFSAITEHWSSLVDSTESKEMDVTFTHFQMHICTKKTYSVFYLILLYLRVNKFI